MPGFHVLRYLLEPAQVHVHRVSDAILKKKKEYPCDSKRKQNTRVSQNNEWFVADPICNPAFNSDIIVTKYRHLCLARERLLPTWYNLKDTEGPQITSVKSQSWYLVLCSRSTASDVGSLSRKIYSEVIPGRDSVCAHFCPLSALSKAGRL